MASVLEAIMLVCFGLSWPINAIKAYKAQTAAGTSWAFLALITFGYVAGIAAKFVGGMVNWVLAVYFLNLAALAVNCDFLQEPCRRCPARGRPRRIGSLRSSPIYSRSGKLGFRPCPPGDERSQHGPFHR